ncbi:MAG: trehalose-phosphatase [Dehalococcoidia bacterium]
MAKELTGIEPLLPIIRQRPLGVMSDIDGTLAPIVARPEKATVPEPVRSLLRELLAKGVRVAAITGRPLETARRMVGVEGVAYATDHGLTLWVEGKRESAPGLAEYEPLALATERELADLAGSAPGVQIENTGALLAVHYRNAVEPEGAREAILAAIERSEAARRFEVREGRMVVELRPPIAADKGTALAALTERLGLAAAVCLGDDVTDIDMFRAAVALRGVEAVTVAVASAEAAPEVMGAADYWIAPEGVEWLLGEIAQALDAGG